MRPVFRPVWEPSPHGLDRLVAGWPCADGIVELIAPGSVPPPHARVDDALGRLEAAKRDAIDAILRLVGGAPEDSAEALEDLRITSIEFAADSFRVDLEDGCGEHLPEGYWFAVTFAPDLTHPVASVEA